MPVGGEVRLFIGDELVARHPAEDAATGRIGFYVAEKGLTVKLRDIALLHH